MRRHVWFVFAAAFATSATWAQHAQPYAGQQARAIKALSDAEVDDLLAGRGAGLARAAELNGFPGPIHVLEHALALMLTPQQRAASEALIAPMRAVAQKHGAAVVAAEREIDAMFAKATVTPETLRAKLDEAAAAQGRVRQAHLDAHIAQRAILTPEQIAAYATLRGYGGGTSRDTDRGQQHQRHH